MIVGSAVKEEALVEDEAGGHETGIGKRESGIEKREMNAWRRTITDSRFPISGFDRQARDSASTSSHSPGNP
jgi:hypothetical protein